MFSRFVALLAIVSLAVAAPQGANDAPHTGSNTPQTGSNAPGTGSNTPNTGNVSQCAASSQYCCNQKFSNPTQLAGDIGGVLNAISGVTVPTGLTCTPISTLGLGSASDCTDQPACCTKNTDNGVADVLCSTIAVNA